RRSSTCSSPPSRAARSSRPPASKTTRRARTRPASRRSPPTTRAAGASGSTSASRRSEDAMRVRFHFLFLAILLLACSHSAPGDADRVYLDAVGESGDGLGLPNAPLALGGSLELAAREPDPATPGYTKHATVAGYLVDHPEVLAVRTAEASGNLV